jgi:hypothetical protein
MILYILILQGTSLETASVIYKVQLYAKCYYWNVECIAFSLEKNYCNIVHVGDLTLCYELIHNVA